VAVVWGFKEGALSPIQELRTCRVDGRFSEKSLIDYLNNWVVNPVKWDYCYVKLRGRVRRIENNGSN